LLRSIATLSLSGSLQEKLQAIAAAKYDLVELCENDLLFCEDTPRDIRRQAEDLGLKIAAFQPFREFEAMPQEALARGLERAERKFDVMAELGAPLMVVCSNVSAAAQDDDALAAAQLRELAERAARRGLKIGYQALPWARHVRTVARAGKITTLAAHPHLGQVLNSFHTLAINDDLRQIGAVAPDKIFWVQLADAPRLGMELRAWSRHFRCFPGQGDLDVTGFLHQVVQTGYAGPVSLEIFNDEFQASPPRQIANDGMRSMIWLEEQVRDRIEATTHAAPPRVTLVDPPKPPKVEGVAFLEFAVGGFAEAPLSAQFLALGFQLWGRHKTKAVTLWRQGEVLIAVNAEQDAFAHSFYLVHGPSVCAIGLKLDDSARFLARAEAFGCAKFEGRTGADDRPMPAIRRPDGSLLYAVSADFDPSAEFNAEPVTDDAPLITGFDHIGEAVSARQMDSWLLFYRAVVGLDPAESWDLPDPYGLVRSRAMANAERSVRFPLSFSDSARTSVARSLTTFVGAGVNQIAFSTDDIFLAAQTLSAKGAKFLAIPDNYYDDLAARFDLDEAMIDRLSRHGILYDRDDNGGEFFHVYTELFDGRFFFELVQRRGGYDQYGAPNAAVRMAAQTRAAPALSAL
jgi:4-hydroxyphenylpyruvate dioxygenase